MGAEPITRDGELTHQALVDAVATERAEGRRPVSLAVGSYALMMRALGILSSSDAGLDAVRESFPRVAIDVGLGENGWQLREA